VDRKLLRRRWRRAMQVITALCVLAAAGLAAVNLSGVGLRAFFDRPPGVGATRPLAADDGPTPAATGTPQAPIQATPAPAVTPVPAPTPATPPPPQRPPRPPLPPRDRDAVPGRAPHA